LKYRDTTKELINERRVLAETLVDGFPGIQETDELNEDELAVINELEANYFGST
jgi:hypothetical protein